MGNLGRLTWVRHNSHKLHSLIMITKLHSLIMSTKHLSLYFYTHFRLKCSRKKEQATFALEAIYSDLEDLKQSKSDIFLFYF